MTGIASDKTQSANDSGDEKERSQNQPVYTSSSTCSSPDPSGMSVTGSLGAELSQVSLSCSPANLQLEQLANTNLLLIRTKFNKEAGEYSIESLIAEIESIAHHYNGSLVSAANIEQYDHLPDGKRLKILEENKDIYIFENGNTEYAHSYEGEEPKHDNDWKYDKVIGIQFKRSNAMKSASGKLEQLFKSRAQQIAQWSISTNEHALAQPGNLYIKGVPKDMSMDQVVPMFSKFGPISSFKLIRDSVTGKSLGYGFISYPLGSHASKCIAELNGKTIGSSTLFINFHIERKERERIYRDSIKESNDDEKFKGIFVGNLPLSKSSEENLSPSDVIQLFKDKLSPFFPDLAIVSYYFPKKSIKEEAHFEGDKAENGMDKRENDDVSSPKDDVISSESVSTTLSQSDDCLTKNYGFIKFKHHLQALKAIEIFNDYTWFGSNLIVNKAVQNKSHTWHQRKTGGPSTMNNRSDNRYHGPHNPYGYFGGHGNVYFPYMNSQGSILAGDIGPQDHEVSYPLSRPMSTGSYVSSYHSFGAIPPPGQAPPSGLFETPSPGNSIFPLGSYGTMPSNVPFGLPLPTRDQQESNLYVKHLPLSWKDDDLKEFYQEYGEIISAKIITVGGSKSKSQTSQASDEVEGEDPKNLGTSRGYGFVCFKNPLDASRAILATDGYHLTETHILHVSFAQKRAKSNQGNVKNSNSPSDYDPLLESPFFHTRSLSRRASFNDHPRGQYSMKYFNPMRHPRSPAAGSFPSGFVNGGAHNWPGIPILPSGPPALSSVPFMPPNAATMSESAYSGPAFSGNESDFEAAGEKN